MDLEGKEEEEGDVDTVPMVFRWEHGGRQVYITGTFNNWERQIPMHRSGNDFTYIHELRRGKHAYKFVVDDEWRFAPGETRRSAEAEAPGKQARASAGSPKAQRQGNSSSRRGWLSHVIAHRPTDGGGHRGPDQQLHRRDAGEAGGGGKGPGGFCLGRVRQGTWRPDRRLRQRAAAAAAAPEAHHFEQTVRKCRSAGAAHSATCRFEPSVLHCHQGRHDGSRHHAAIQAEVYHHRVLLPDDVARRLDAALAPYPERAVAGGRDERPRDHAAPPEDCRARPAPRLRAIADSSRERLEPRASEHAGDARGGDPDLFAPPRLPCDPPWSFPCGR
eukprot:scaffold699_cov231-Pinguiococcus_pyrenoidosus.AAC.18